jgi:uncharacterized protein (TIGR02271 family)
MMSTETIVAVYDTPAHAELAVADLEAAGIPTQSIQHYTRDHFGEQAYAPTHTTYDPAQDAPAEKSESLWGWLFGEDHTDHHHEVYSRSLQSGSTVVTVVTAPEHADRIISILEEHAPVDLEQRGASYGSVATGATTASATKAGFAESQPAYDTARTGIAGNTEEVIPLSEETIQIGKREVDRGTTRVRRYVVERPVEEQVRLRDERVAVFRRPASGAAVGAEAFTDKVVHVTETAEEAVIGKTARVVEEVVVQKKVDERAETVRDTVRKEEVEITGPHGAADRVA